MRVLCFIPARMASSRYPGKPLAPLLGLGLVLHVYRRCRLLEGVDEVIITTCDEEIAEAARAEGASVIMTRDTHPGCVDRVEEALEYLPEPPADDDLILMVQGDEVLVTPEMMQAVIDAYRTEPSPVVNLASPLARPEDQDDPNAVKVVAAPDGRALFFSRSGIPNRSRAPEVIAYQQTGVIGFSASFLKTFGKLEQTPLELIEKIDMLRTLEHGYPIRIVKADRETIGVDTPADLKRAEQVLREDPVTARYMTIPEADA
jgi:3-deoxy-manno-octulosonate cytidylyltransferase (CMP-KDO synthetase)